MAHGLATAERTEDAGPWPAPNSEVLASWSGKDWTLSVHSDLVVLDRDTDRLAYAGPATAELSLGRSWFRWYLLTGRNRTHCLRGLSRGQARSMRLAVARLALEAVCAWADRVERLIASAQAEQRWIPREHVDQLLATRPSPEFTNTITDSRVSTRLDDRQRSALLCLNDDLERTIASVNEAIMESELGTRQDFFDNVERSPLTAEQARAVVCFDNRVQVIASAGSGKTSLMVARAAYAVSRGFVAPDRILLLAFNKDAAAELQTRLESRFAALGLDGAPKASTFHAFGLRVIGEATGAKPRLASWVDNGQDTKEISSIVDVLRGHSTKFRYQWDLYRLLFAGAPIEADGGDPDGYDKKTDTQGFHTFRGEVVRSHGELMIANWLFLNGVSYEYERPYSHPVATAHHSQYQPDFYYPEADVWHEHWALDRNGAPPSAPEFAGYAEGIDWKRECHRFHGTVLVESTWAEIIDGGGFAPLQESLEQHGLIFDWNPDRPIAGSQPMKHDDLIRFVRTFMTHVKSNSLNREALTERLQDKLRHLGGYRTALFVEIYWEIHDEWERRLRADNLVDFEDMLVLAAEHLEAGGFDPDYDLVMVDEFQDASNARARIVRGLLRRPGRFLLAVGDDWQSVNRFAGSDLSVMTNFEEWFGPGPELRLEQTFRCPQSICDAATGFVMKNPRQLPKEVRSDQVDVAPSVRIVCASHQGSADALAQHLEELAAQAIAGQIAPGVDGRISVKVLGRYRFDGGLMPKGELPGLDVQFLTVHRSKGLEADYIVVPRIVTGKYGFPSGIVDDPLLELVMAAPDLFPHAEERRLFYVALTRARRGVLLITEQGYESPFVKELVNDGVAIVEGQPALIQCPRCLKGSMLPRQGKFGPFLGCSSYPACNHTQS